MSYDSKIFKLVVSIIAVFSIISTGLANHISGLITDLNGDPLPFASVYIRNTTYGVSSNSFGEYFMEIKDGEYTLIFSSIGYTPVSRKIKVANFPISLNVALEENNQELLELEVVSNTKNKALEVIKSAKETKKKYNQKSYKCVQYSKNSIEKRQFKLTRNDTLNLMDLDTTKNINFDNEILKFIETFGDYYHLQPKGNYWDYIGYHDFADTKPKDDYTIIQDFSDFGEYNITPKYDIDDPYANLMDLINLELNLYENNIKTSITNKPIISPLSPASRTYYKYDYNGFIIENDTNKIHKIKITPRFKSEPLLDGYLYIEDNSFRINSIEVKISGTKQSLFKIENIHFIQDYVRFSDQNLINRKIIDFTIKQDVHKILGNAISINSDFELTEELPQKFKKNQVKFFSDTIDKISNNYWINHRPIDLKEGELAYIHYTDSLREYFNSEEYILKQDSSYNAINFSKIFIEGVGHRNKFKGYSFYIWPVMTQFNFFGIGGYRHNLGFNFKKNISDKYKISTQNNIDYGINNKDFKGTTDVSIISNEKKYKQLTIGIGDQYKLINRYASVVTAFSRSNYVRSRLINTAYRTEIINGLYGECKLEFCQQNPIKNLNLENDIFYEYDSILEFAPVSFIPYRKLETRIQLTWLPFQKFYFKKNKKVVIGTDYPTANFLWRKGIPNLMGSEVDFDYLELGVNHEFTIPQLGISRWNLKMGSFINDKSLRVIEWKYFRGSGYFFLSNPLTSFQLMGPSIASDKPFFRANYLHNFNGNILNKLPIIRRLNTQLTAGLATLLIPNDNLEHVETFFGIEKPFKLFGGLVKIGAYAVTSANTYRGADFEFKIGMSSYNSYSKKWDY